MSQLSLGFTQLLTLKGLEHVAFEPDGELDLFDNAELTSLTQLSGTAPALGNLVI